MCFVYDKFDTANIEQQAENSRVYKRFKSPGYVINYTCIILPVVPIDVGCYTVLYTSMVVPKQLHFYRMLSRVSRDKRSLLLIDDYYHNHSTLLRINNYSRCRR